MTEKEITRDTRILIVEDDAIISRHLQSCLLKLGYQVVGTAASGSEAIRIFGKVSPDLALIDLSLHGELDGIETAAAIHAWHDVPVIFLVGSADEATLQRARTAHPSGYVLQPFERRSLFSTIEMALEKRQLELRTHDNETMLRALVENKGEAIVVIDLDDRITFVNPAAESLFNLPSKDLVGCPIDQFTTHGITSHFHNATGSHHQRNQNLFVTELAHSKGHKRKISTTAINRLDQQGHSAGTFLIMQDVTEKERRKDTEVDSLPLGDAIHEIASILSSSLDVNEVLERILGQVGQVVPHHSASVLVIEGDSLQVVQAKGSRTVSDEAMAALHPIPWKKDPLFLHIYLVGETACVNGDSSIRELVNYPQLHWSASNICAPLKNGKQTIGFLILGHSEAGYYNTQHIERLTAFSGQAAMALDNARLYDQTHQRAQYLSLLNEITQTSIDSAHLNDTMGVISQKMVRLFNADGVTITLWDDLRQHCVQAASTTVNYDSGKSVLNGSIEHALTRSVLAAGKPLVIDDTTLSPIFMTDGQQACNFQTVICFPLISDDQKLGAVIIGFAEPHSFTPQELDRGAQATRQVAMAIAKARFFAEIQRLAITDALTNLLNRRGIFELAQKEVDLAHKLDLPLSMLWLDIDNFKSINDLHGHHIGDDVVREVATRVRATLRERDLVGRYGGEGGDEFIVLLPETDSNGARQVAERLRSLISNSPVVTDRLALQVTVSIGLAALKDKNETLATLLKRADEAMYAAKSAGRDCVIGTA